ncbi:MAG: type II toxin-antitoxin system prevent-host-death family antitoxin, partial [Candidatus Peribacteraceae bacterium]|nr:type II toxin-antitoxin system prevent-host-death family antitoxin [Candidatus Peribacteraceae bacterium]
NFFQHLNIAEKPGMAVTISHEGHPKVIIMSVDEFEGWQETLEVMSDRSLMKDIHEAMQEDTSIPLEQLRPKRHSKLNVQRVAKAKGKKAVRRSHRKR